MRRVRSWRGKRRSGASLQEWTSWGAIHLVERRSMRRGDLLGLNWDDVDLEAATVRVRRPLTRTDNGCWLALGEPKTKKSRRTICCLAQVAVEVLRGHLERQLREIEACGGGQAGVARAAGITAPKVW
jgi:integrase